MNPNNEFDHKVIRNLVSLKPVQERDPVRAEKGKSAFLSEADNIAKSVSSEGIQRHKSWKQKNPIRLFERRKEHTAMLSTFTSIIIALSLLLGGSGATVAAAQASEPGDLLYDIKLLSENTVMDFTSAPESKFDLALNLVDRRANEIISLLSDGDMITPETQTRFDAQVESAIIYAMNLPEDKVLQAFEVIQNRLSTQEQVFNQVKTNGSTEATAVVMQTQNMIQERLRILENSQLQIMNQLQTQEQINNPEQGNSPTNFGENTQNTPDPGNGNPFSTDVPSMNNGAGQEGNSPWFTEIFMDGTINDENGTNAYPGYQRTTTATPKQGSPNTSGPNR